MRARRRPILSVLVFSQLLLWVDNTILGMALKTLADPAEGLGASPGELQWAVGSYTLVFATFMFAAGALGDRFGHRSLLITGMLIFGASSLGAAYAPSPGHLIAARALMGLGSAFVMPATMAILTWTFTGQARASALGLFSASSGIGIAGGPILAGVLLDRFWWGSVFLINVPVVICSLAGALLLVPEFRSPIARRLDLAGLVLSAAGSGAVAYGLIRAGQLVAWRPAQVWAPILLGALLLIVFLVVELRIRDPSFDPRLFAQRVFAGGHLALGALFFAVAGHSFYAAFYLQGARGFSPLAAGVAILPAAAGVMLGAPLSTRLVRRWPVGPVTTAAMSAAGVSFGLYGFLGLRTPLIWHELVIFVQGLAIGMVIAPVTTAVLNTLPLDRAGAGAAVNTTVRQGGSLIGIALLGTVMSVVYRRAVEPDATTAPRPAGERALVSAESARDVAASAHLPELAAAADAAFLHAMRVSSLCAMLCTLAGAAALHVAFRSTAPVPREVCRRSRASLYRSR